MSAPVAPAERPGRILPARALPAGPPAAYLPAPGRRRARIGAAAASHQWWATLLIAAVLCWVAFFAGGGLNLAHMTTVELALTLGAAALAAAVLVRAPAARAYGTWPLALLLAFAALTALSTVWSVQPDASWQDAGRMFAYGALFGVCVLLARAFPTRWPAVLGGLVLAAVVVCAWAVLTKVFPASLDANDIYARLRAPYTYWNAIGLTAAMGAIGCLWLGSRRSGHALLSALAYPAMGLMLLTLLLAYSRGALVALLLGAVIWFCLVPLRLRGAAVLLTGAAGAAVVIAWDFSKHALSADNVPLAARDSAGHQLGALLAAVLIALTLAGLAVGFLSARHAPPAALRRHTGAVLLSVLALACVGFVGALAASHRGLTGSVSHALHSLTDPHARVPPNTPGRLTAIASVRARYWNEALKVFKAHPALGSGAEGYATARLRYRTETLDVRHAHGYAVQTLADLGVVGLALTLALLASWLAAAGRCANPFSRRWHGRLALRGWRLRARPHLQRAREPYTPERLGMLSMLTLVIVFGIHSLVDWTWYVPGDACVALLCAGWLAGRGPLAGGGPLAAEGRLPAEALPARSGPPAATPAGAHTPRLASAPRTGSARGIATAFARGRDQRALALAGAVIAGALLAAWAQWQPQRSVDASQRALALLTRDPRGAEAQARTAVARDPLSEQALITLSVVQQAGGRTAAARTSLVHAVHLQPSNPQSWLALGEYDLARQRALGAGSPAGHDSAHAAARELAAGIYLNPELIAPEAIAQGNREAIFVQNAYVEALRANATPLRSAPAAPRPAAAPARRAVRRHRAR